MSPPRSAQLDSDSAQRQYLCDTSGTSFYYAESLDVTARTRTIVTHSCPNHFALCQSSQCGGDLKTRALISEQVVVVPLYPTISRTAPIDTTCSDRLLGVALNGVGLYGVSDGQTRECVDLLGDTAAGTCFTVLLLSYGHAIEVLCFVVFAIFLINYKNTPKLRLFQATRATTLRSCTVAPAACGRDNTTACCTVATPYGPWVSVCCILCFGGER